MKLHEYQTKQLLASCGISVPQGAVARSALEVQQIAMDLGFPVAVKAQVLAGGRGKAGGIVIAHGLAEALVAARRLLGSELKGLPVRQLLVEQAVPLVKELYLGLALDRARARMALIASAEGGVEIEQLAGEHPERVFRHPIDPVIGLRSFETRHLAALLGLERGQWAAFHDIAARLYHLAQAHDALLAEINPLAITRDRGLMALDGKMIIDDNALFRQPTLAAEGEMLSSQEQAARDVGASYIKLDGSVGCMVNGAGLAMATMDVIQLCGGQAANFLDIGGGAPPERVQRALEIMLADSQVRAVLINIFGGITRCDLVAQGMVEALRKIPTQIPIVVRLAGTNEAEGRRILERARLRSASGLFEAAQMAVAAAKETP